MSNDQSPELFTYGKQTFGIQTENKTSVILSHQAMLKNNNNNNQSSSQSDEANALQTKSSIQKNSGTPEEISGLNSPYALTSKLEQMSLLNIDPLHLNQSEVDQARGQIKQQIKHINSLINQLVLQRSSLSQMQAQKNYEMMVHSRSVNQHTDVNDSHGLMKELPPTNKSNN